MSASLNLFEVVPRGQWPATSSAASCATCKKQFGMFRTAANCHACGRVCCSACLETHFVLPGAAGTSPVPVCGECATGVRRFQQESEMAVHRCRILEEMLSEQANQAHALRLQLDQIEEEIGALKEVRRSLEVALRRAELQAEVAAAQAAVASSPSTATHDISSRADEWQQQQEEEAKAALEKRQKQLDAREATLQEALKKVSSDAAKVVAQRAQLQERERQGVAQAVAEAARMFEEARRSCCTALEEEREALLTAGNEWLRAAHGCTAASERRLDDDKIDDEVATTARQGAVSEASAASSEAEGLRAEVAALVRSHSREQQEWSEVQTGLEKRIAALMEDVESQFLEHERLQSLLTKYQQQQEQQVDREEDCEKVRASMEAACQFQVGITVEWLLYANQALFDNVCTRKECAFVEAQSAAEMASMVEQQQLHGSEVEHLRGRCEGGVHAARQLQAQIVEGNAQNTELNARIEALASDNRHLAASGAATTAELDALQIECDAVYSNKDAQRLAVEEEEANHAARSAAAAILQQVGSVQEVMLAQHSFFLSKALAFIIDTPASPPVRRPEVAPHQENVPPPELVQVQRQLAATQREVKDKEVLATAHAQETLACKRELVAAKEEVEKLREKVRRCRRLHTGQRASSLNTVTGDSPHSAQGFPYSIRSTGTPSTSMTPSRKEEENKEKTEVRAPKALGILLRSAEQWWLERIHLYEVYLHANVRLVTASHAAVQNAAAVELRNDMRAAQHRSAAALEHTTGAVRILQEDMRERVARVATREADVTARERRLAARKARVLHVCKQLAQVTARLRQREGYDQDGVSGVATDIDVSEDGATLAAAIMNEEAASDEDSCGDANVIRSTRAQQSYE